MRIALISPLFESVPPRLYGGTERVVYNLCRGLTESDIEVTLFASGDSVADGKLVPVVDEALRLKRPSVFDAHAYTLRMLSLVAARAGEFDLIHNHHDYWMLPLTEMVDVPLLTTLHGRLDLPDIPAAFMSYPKASYVSISDSQRGPLGLLDWRRTIHHGIDTSEFEFRPQPGKYLAFLGRMSKDKRPEWAVEISKRSGIPLKMAAKIDDESRPHFEEHVLPHVDGKFIEYVGEINEREKADFLGNALGLVFPIDWPEPFGLVMIEALAHGTPVLARPCGAVPEILADGITGYVHPDIEVLARGAQDLTRISRQECRQWVENRFSLKKMTEAYIDVYRELTQGAGPGTGRIYAGSGRRTAGHRRNLLHSI